MTNTEKYLQSSSDILPGNTEAPVTKKAKKLQPEYQDDIEIINKKLKVSDYENIVQALIFYAISEYECLVVTQNAFLNMTIHNKWAKKVWKSACMAAEEMYNLVDCVNSLVSESIVINGFPSTYYGQDS